MRTRTKTLWAAAALGIPLVAAAPSAAAHDTTGTGNGPTTEAELRADLRPVPHPAGAFPLSGRAEVELSGTWAEVHLRAAGAAPGLNHLVHIHGDVQARNECPTAAFDGNPNDPNAKKDGLISVSEGLFDLPDGTLGYGPVQVSFTTSGAVDAASGGALTRMPLADGRGRVSYERQFALPTPVFGPGDPRDRSTVDLTAGGLAASIASGNMHVVIHGADLNHNGRYDGPAEVSLPVACGTLAADR